jgi:hypothetical protein
MKAEIIRAKKVIDAAHMPQPGNLYTYSTDYLKISTKAEKVFYGSLAALGGIVTCLIAYFHSSVNLSKYGRKN